VSLEGGVELFSREKSIGKEVSLEVGVGLFSRGNLFDADIAFLRVRSIGALGLTFGSSVRLERSSGASERIGVIKFTDENWKQIRVF